MSFLRFSIVVVLLFAAVSGCVPTVRHPNARTTPAPDNGGLDGNSTTEMMEETTTKKLEENQDSESAHFEIKVFPPTSWTYPSKRRFFTNGQQRDEFQARYEIQKTISEAVNEVLRFSAIPSDSVIVSVDDSVSIIADIVEDSNRLQHSCIAKSRSWSVILGSEEKTITKKCSGGIEEAYSPDKITGSFSTDLLDAPVVWKMLEEKLGNVLKKMHVVVSDEISVLQNKQ